MSTPETKRRHPVTPAQARRLIACLILYAVYLLVTVVLCSGPAGGLLSFLFASVMVILFTGLAIVFSLLGFGLLLIGVSALLHAIALHDEADKIDQLARATDGLFCLAIFLAMLLLPLYALIHYL